MGLNRYWIIIRRRKWLVVGCLLGWLAVAIALNALTTPVYRSSIQVEIMREPTRSPLTGAVTESSTPQSDNQALFTAAEMLTSRTLMAQVVAALERQRTPVEPQQWIKPVFGAKGKRTPPRTAAPTESASAEGERLEQQIDWLLAGMTVEPLRDTRLIRINVEQSDGKVAAEIANAIAQNFVRSQQSQRSETETTLASFLNVQAADVRTRIEEREKQTRDTMRPGLLSLDGRIRQLTQTTSELNDSYAKTKTQELSLSSQLEQVRRVSRSAGIDPGDIPIHTEAVDALRRDLVRSNDALAKARGIYGTNHPKLAALQSENEEMRRNLRREVGNAVFGLDNDRSVLLSREESLRAAIAQAEGELRSLKDQAERFSTIEGELKSDRELYNLLIARVHEVEITGEIKSPSLRVVEPAATESEPVRPRKILNLGVGLILGLLSGPGVAFLLEASRRTIRTPHDVNKVLQLPVLGLIPKESLP